MSKVTLKKSGKEKSFDVLYSLTINKIEYLVYTDGKLDEDGFSKYYVGVLKNEDGKEKLIPVENEDVLETINTYITKFSSGN